MWMHPDIFQENVGTWEINLKNALLLIALAEIDSDPEAFDDFIPPNVDGNENLVICGLNYLQETLNIYDNWGCFTLFGGPG